MAYFLLPSSNIKVFVGILLGPREVELVKGRQTLWLTVSQVDSLPLGSSPL